MYVDDGGGIKLKTVKDLRVQAFIDECLLWCPQNYCSVSLVTPPAISSKLLPETV